MSVKSFITLTPGRKQNVKKFFDKISVFFDRIFVESESKFCQKQFRVMFFENGGVTR